MPEIDFGQDDQDAVFALKGWANRVNSDLYDNGKKGLVTNFNTFVTDFNAREDERQKQHKQNKDRLNIIIAILALIVSYLVYIETSHHDQKSLLRSGMSVTVASLNAKE